MEVYGQLHAPSSFTPRLTAPGAHWIGGYVGPSAGLDLVAKRKNFPATAGNRTPVVRSVA
jgi:hypothetical protein